MKKRRVFKHLLVDESMHCIIKELSSGLGVTMVDLIANVIEFSLRNDKSIPLPLVFKMYAIKGDSDVSPRKAR